VGSVAHPDRILTTVRKHINNGVRKNNANRDRHRQLRQKAASLIPDEVSGDG
jgi:hypothetical protein